MLGPEHWTAIILGILGLLGTLVGGIFAWLQGLNKRTAALRAANEKRASDMEARIQKLELRERLSWLYIRSLIDSHYRNAPGVPLPAPPEGWNEH